VTERIPRATDTAGLLLGDLHPGDRVGEYVIDAPCASRGTGHVYEATHRLLPRRVHIKVIPAAHTGTSVGVDLLREACMVESLDHPGIPRVHECGLLADRRPWIATEMVDGVSLAKRYDGDRISLREAVSIVRHVAEILEHAHARGLAHRNVTPDAIVFPIHERRFPLCLVDWSAARTRDSRSPQPMATPTQCTAPEHVHGNVDERADIHALGVIAHELLRVADPERRPPVFTALVETMVARAPDARPCARIVREHAAWLVLEIEHAAADDTLAIPMVIHEERTEVMTREPTTS
jgi:serine/threonine-protein kinase